MLTPNSEQFLAEAAYAHIREHVTKEQMAEMIHQLLSDNEIEPFTKKVVIRMAMIYSTQEGN
jgi:hypothetical protein